MARLHLARPLSSRSIITEVRIQLAQQRPHISRPLLIAAAAAFAGSGLVAAVTAVTNIPAEALTRDALAVAEAPLYIGLLSNIGLMIWAAAAAILLFSWALLRRIAPGHVLKPLMLASSLLTVLLLVDDAFMLHEELLPNTLGIPEGLVLGSYAAMGGAYLLFNWRAMLRTYYLPALIAGGLLGASLAIDVVLPMSSFETFVEDSLKFAGILSWLAYAVTVAGQIIDELRTCQCGSIRPDARKYEV